MNIFSRILQILSGMNFQRSKINTVVQQSREKKDQLNLTSSLIQKEVSILKSNHQDFNFSESLRGRIKFLDKLYGTKNFIPEKASEISHETQNFQDDTSAYLEQLQKILSTQSPPTSTLFDEVLEEEEHTTIEKQFEFTVPPNLPLTSNYQPPINPDCPRGQDGAPGLDLFFFTF